MKLKTSLVLMLPALTLIAASLQAAEPAPPAAAEAAPAADAPATESTATEVPTAAETSWLTVITPRLFAFDYFDGVGEDKTHYLERYDYRESLSGNDTRSGWYADLDLDITANDGDRDFFVLERRGFGEHNHRGFVKYGSDTLSVYGAYSHYRSATGGIDYLFRPDEDELDKYGTGGTAPGGGGGGGDGSSFSTTFNNDANRYDYKIDRTTYSAGLKAKPTLLDGWATVAVDYSGYQREGNKFAPFLLNGLGNSTANAERWRGINLAIDERMNRIGLTLTASPQKLFELAYEVSYEEFVNSAPELQMQRDITGPAGINLPNGSTAVDSLFYVADSNLITHGIRASKNFDNRVLVAAGYGASWLEQDSFSRLEINSGRDTGKIRTDNAYLTANGFVSPEVTLEGYVKYYSHDNDSTFPDALANTSTLASPRINNIDAMDYGVSANWRPDFIGSNLTLGWRHLDRERDLTWATIAPAQSLYSEDTVSDEIYLNWSARPAQGWTTRLKPSYVWSDETGLVTEPEEAFLIKTSVSYAAPQGWMASGFYDYKNRKNGNKSFTDGNGLTSQSQSLDGTLHSAGLSLNHTPRDYLNIYGNLYWMQYDVSTYLFTSNPRRWENNVVFTLVDEPNYKIDSYVFNLGGDWDINEKLNLSASYTYTRSKGDVASGTVYNQLVAATGTVDAVIDNTLHSFAVGSDYLLGERSTIKLNYIYDRYNDDAYDLLSGGVHTLALGLAYALQ
jgi:hypothetical protein